MGRITVIGIVVKSWLWMAPTFAAESAKLVPEVTDPKALDAYSAYWDAFESYEAKNKATGQAKFQDAWQKVRSEYSREHLRVTAEQLGSLLKSAAKYRQHLESHPDADNKPYVLLNLAQILAIAADHQDRHGPDDHAGSANREEALSLLRDLDKEFPSFPMKDQGLYLRALLLESEGRKNDARVAWETLAKDAKPTRYTLYALIALGDHAFQEGRAGDAMQAYEKALTMTPSENMPDGDWERLRIQYRYVWAAYRATELGPVLSTGLELLMPGRKAASKSQRERIEADAIQLIGDTLYETNNSKKTREILRRKDLGPFASAIGYRVITRQFGNGLYQDAAQLGEWLADEFPLSQEIPGITQISADAYAKLGRPTPRLHILEKMAMLLPQQSLWRAQQKDAPEAIKAMEQVGRSAAVFAATAHYEQGLSSGAINAFKSAASLFDTLLTFEPNGEDSNTWRLRRAHCHYFIGEYDQAKEMYHALKADYRVSPDILQLASYQAVQTDEKRWRDAYGKALERGEDPRKAKTALDALADLEKSVDDFALRFPGQSRSLDLLLVAGSANRDMERYEQATKFWQRVLVLGGLPAQRKLALHGLLYAAMKSGSAEKVIESARRILKTENMTALGQETTNELLGVLATATQDEAKRLNEQGKVLDAGILLTAVTEDYEAIPDRDRMFRDGAYMLAIAGEWGRAEKASQAYFTAGLTKNRADMTYLLARAQEYQLRLHDSALKYLELGEKYPGHARASTSLDRAAKLGLAEGDYLLAAKAAELEAEQTQSSAERLKAFSRSVDYLEKAADPSRALAMARRRLRASRSTSERLSSRVLMARLTYQTGSEQEALDELEILPQQIEKAKGQMSAEDYANLHGEVNVLLGNEQKRKFDDFAILDRGGNIDGNIKQKSKYFEELVLYFDRAAAKGSPAWAAEARYKIATAADALASEISSVAVRSNLNLTFKTKSRYQVTIERLQELSRRYLSANILASRRNPTAFKDVEWVKRSSTRLSSDLSEAPEKRYQEQLPSARSTNQINEWSF